MNKNSQLITLIIILTLSISWVQLSRAEDGMIEDQTPVQKETQDSNMANMDVKMDTPSGEKSSTKEKAKEQVKEEVKDPS